MLTKEQKGEYRADLFRHLDGIATAPVAYCMYEKGILEFILQKKEIRLQELVDQFKANNGYLNIALHVLCSQGWLDYKLDNENNTVKYITNENSEIAFGLCHLYKDVVDLMKFSEKFPKRKFHKEPFSKLNQIFEKYKLNYDLNYSKEERIQKVQQQILKHIEGMICGPTVVALGMGGMFHKYFMEASFMPDEFHEDAESFGKILDFFSFLGWFEKKRETYRFTDKGVFYARRASAYGVTVSYIPTFRKLEELIFGNPKALWDVPDGSVELHVDREMNVWGSGGAHSTYFKKIDEVIVSLFNKPLHEQPKGIVDMGCGNGAFLKHIYEVIEQRTDRGKVLDEHPLFLVGADFNKTALKVTRRNLIKADIWAKIIWGDIGRPDILANDLKEDYNIELNDLLNVRTFLDHNRVWEEPNTSNLKRVGSSTGAFAFRGKRINSAEVEENLSMHLKRWAPYVNKFGLLVIELHTISPTLISENIGKTAATAYNATHGFSDQYIVEVDIFNKIAKEVGLFPDERYFSKYPNSELATVSINLLKGK